ncbi:MAG: hypothetical protein LUC22_02300 [Prevotella sp.]|nr:hypothetical protein [Prevotella sp.]
MPDINLLRYLLLGRTLTVDYGRRAGYITFRIRHVDDLGDCVNVWDENVRFGYKTIRKKDIETLLTGRFITYTGDLANLSDKCRVIISNFKRYERKRTKRHND